MTLRNATLILLVLWAVLLIAVLHEPARSSDLLAVWIAAQAFAGGETAAIYSDAQGLFTMQPPLEWAARATANGYVGQVFPYVYPPLWAALLAPVTKVMDFQTFADLFRGLNIALLTATGWLAWRINGAAIPPPVHVAAGQVVALTTLFGTLALSENQPQVLVTFLIALAIEPLRHGAPVAAGAALAVAAAIKIYPALFIVLILAARRYRAGAAFAVVAATLAGASVAMAGWPLHEVFLAELRRISATGLEIGPSFNLDRLLAPLFAPDTRQVVLGLLSDGTYGEARWRIAPKTALWQAVNSGVLLLILASLAVWMRRACVARRYGAVWPAAVILLALPGPIAWAYYFCLPILMLPGLVPALGPRRTLFLAALILLPFSIAAFTYLPLFGLRAASITPWGLPAMAITAVVFIVFGGRPDRPLRRAGHPL